MEAKLRHRKLPPYEPARSPQDWDACSAWKEFRNGSELAFTAIYKRYAVDLYHYGERLTGNKQIIEDSLHDLFVELWRQRSKYKPVRHLKFYLLKSFRNRLLKNIRRNKRIADMHDIDISLAVEIEWPDVQYAEVQRKLMEQSINGLSGREKQAVLLRFYDELTYEEIASLLCISTKSTYKLMYRALGALRKTLATVARQPKASSGGS